MRPALALVFTSAAAGLALQIVACSGAAVAPPPPFVEVSKDGLTASTASARAPMTMRTSLSETFIAPVLTTIAEEGSCGVSIPADFGRGCRVLVPSKLSATSSVGSAVNAFDASTCTAWSAGAAAPQSITVDLGSVMDIDGLVLVPEMTRDGSVKHKIEVSDDGVRFEVSQRIDAPMSNGSAAELKLPTRERARFVRFSTEASPSPIAWREISLVQCGT